MRKEIELTFLSTRREELKQLLYRLDKGICHICRKKIPYAEINLDHIIPRVNSQQDTHHEYWNLRIAHKICNTRRGAGRIEGQMRLPLPLTVKVYGNNHNTGKWERHLEKLKRCQGNNVIAFWRKYRNS